MTRHDDLKDFTTQADWFATIAIPTPSSLDDARARFETEWRNARRRLADHWDETELELLDERVLGLDHRDSASVVVVHARGGATLIEQLDEPITSPRVDEGPVPRWATVLVSRQRTIAHVVVEADRAGADLTAFDGGQVLATETVDGETLHIHRGHPGGWSQRRFQQRAENTWQSNARDVAESVAVLARDVDARLVAVAGDVRAQTFILESMPPDIAGVTTKVEAGSPEGVADEVVRLLSTIVAERITASTAQLRAGLDAGTSSIDTATIVEALGQGRVDTLLVHDDTTDGPDADPAWLDGARLVDRAIVTALATDAEVLVVPGLAVMEGPLAAILRW